MRRSVRSLAAVAAVAALGLAACTGGTSSSSSSDAEQTYGPGALPTVTDGKLTVATSDPAYSPWILNNDPASGEGYESAVIYALAEELGYSADNVQWVRATFDSSITPGAKDWDLNIQQFSITDERKNAVDFTSPYYTTTSAIITKAGTPAADAKSIADLKDVLIGVQAGTTSQQFASENLEPGLTQKLQMLTPPTTRFWPCRRGAWTRSSSTCRPRSTWSPRRSMTASSSASSTTRRAARNTASSCPRAPSSPPRSPPRSIAWPHPASSPSCRKSG